MRVNTDIYVQEIAFGRTFSMTAHFAYMSCNKYSVEFSCKISTSLPMRQLMSELYFTKNILPRELEIA